MRLVVSGDRSGIFDGRGRPRERRADQSGRKSLGVLGLTIWRDRDIRQPRILNLCFAAQPV
jgi:hypothetical protein